MNRGISADRLAIPPAAVVAALLLTRLVSLSGMLAAKRGDLGAVLGMVATNTYDASWYRHIALNAYADPRLDGPVTVFYPGYPIVVAALLWPVRLAASWFVGAAPAASLIQGVALPAAMLLVSNAALLGALIILWRLYHARLGATATVLGLGFLLAAPTSFFFSIGYSESLFLFFVAAALLLAGESRWIGAGLCGAAACLVRFPGAFLIIPLAILWLQSGRARPVRSLAIGAGAFALGAVAYPAWLWAISGDPLAYLHLQQAHHRFLAGPVRALGTMTQQAGDAVRVLMGRPSNQRLVDVPTIAANSVALVAGVLTTLLGWTRLHAYEVVWVALVFLVPLVSSTGESLDRYWLGAFPFFFLLGWWLRRWPILAIALMAVSTAWLYVLAYNFGRVIWVG